MDCKKNKKIKKNVLLATVTTFTFFPFFFLLRVDYFGEEIEFLLLLNISRIPSVKSLLPSFPAVH